MLVVPIPVPITHTYQPPHCGTPSLTLTHETLPSIHICNTEVRIPLYRCPVDLHTAYHTPDSIYTHTVASSISPVLNIDSLCDISRNIVYNQELIQRSSLLTPTLAPTNDTMQAEGALDMRQLEDRQLRELDDLHVAQMVVEKKERERAGSRCLFSKLG